MKKEIINKIIDDLPHPDVRCEMSKQEWYGWFEELFDKVCKQVIPTKDEAVSEGYRKAMKSDYNLRLVLKYEKDDRYYSGWLDCFDWLFKRTKKNSKP